MPNVERIAARIEREGQLISVGGETGEGPITAYVQAVVRGYRAEELVNDIDQGDREVTIAPIALLAAGFPRAPERLDKVGIDGGEATVQSCETRKLRGAPAMHIVQVRGG